MWVNTGAYSWMLLSLALGRFQSASRSSRELPGYEPVTGASLGMSVPWFVCVMPGEVKHKQRTGASYTRGLAACWQSRPRKLQATCGGT